MTAGEPRAARPGNTVGQCVAGQLAPGHILFAGDDERGRGDRPQSARERGRRGFGRCEVAAVIVRQHLFNRSFPHQRMIAPERFHLLDPARAGQRPVAAERDRVLLTRAGQEAVERRPLQNQPGDEPGMIERELQGDPAALRHSDEDHRAEVERLPEQEQVVDLGGEIGRCRRAAEAAAVDGDQAEAFGKRALRRPDAAIERPAVEQQQQRPRADALDGERAAGDGKLEGLRRALLRGGNCC